MKNSQSTTPQHKRLAMGQQLKSGGLVKPSIAGPKTGFRDTPLEKSKRANGIVGMKKGGSCDCEN